MRENAVNIAYVCDQNYLVELYVSLLSLIRNKKESSLYHIYIVTAGLSEEILEDLKKLESKRIRIKVIEESVEPLRAIDEQNESKGIRVANTSALLKFILPQVLKRCKKVLYIDVDTIIQVDLSELYATQLGENYAGVIIDSGSIYYKHKYVRAVEKYFNSGVMLLNLKRMRMEKVTKQLIECKKNMTDSLLMDQDVFNVVFNKKVVFLSIKYNFMVVNLERARGRYSIDDINETYGEKYGTFDEMKADACIVHYASKDKPWKNREVAMASLWYYYYDKVKSMYSSYMWPSFGESREPIKVSVVIPCYNVEAYILESLMSVLKQTLKEIEVICINDGSQDSTLDILEQCKKEDARITIVSQENKGQAVARNIGIRQAGGQYIYFLDSDDFIAQDALELLYEEAEAKQTDVLYFDGTCFFETEKLEREYGNYISYYSRKESYPLVVSGQDMYLQMSANSDYIVSPCMQFFKRAYLIANQIKFHEGTIYEDNFFTLVSMLKAQRVSHIPKQLFYRRVRANSTMTSNRTKEYCCGLYECIKDTLQLMQENDYDRHIILVIAKQLSGFISKYENFYEQLSEEEKQEMDEYMQNLNIKIEHLDTPMVCLKNLYFYVAYLEREKCRLTQLVKDLRDTQK